MLGASEHEPVFLPQAAATVLPMRFSDSDELTLLFIRSEVSGVMGRTAEFELWLPLERRGLRFNCG